MGTNFYYEVYRTPPCKHCQRYDTANTLHIGKSSGGWYFTLHIIPDENIHTLDGWFEYFASNPGVIKNEYGDVVSVEELRKIITERFWEKRSEKDILSACLGHYTSMEDYYRKNYAEPGINNLLRHSMALDSGCCGHGEGTWSYFKGEFS